MHRKRRLREPVKIHRRRRNCIMRAVAPSVRLYKHSFSGFLATRPMSAGTVSRNRSRAGNLFYHDGTGIHPCPATASYHTTKSGLSTRDFLAQNAQNCKKREPPFSRRLVFRGFKEYPDYSVILFSALFSRRASRRARAPRSSRRNRCSRSSPWRARHRGSDT